MLVYVLLPITVCSIFVIVATEILFCVLRVDLYKKYNDTSCFINKLFLFTNHYILSK